MRALIDDPERRRQLVENARRVAERFYGPNVARFLKDQLEAVRGKRATGGAAHEDQP